MEPELRAALDAAATARGLSRSALVRQALLAVVDLDLVALGLQRRTASEIRAQLKRDLVARRTLEARGMFAFRARHNTPHTAEG
jgi:ribbon-helix-helix CopG family protein